jgi:hypothetical protein
MRFSGFRTKTVVMVFAAVGTTSAFGYWGYGELRAYQLRDEITALVTDASLRVQTALSARLPPATMQNPAVLRRFYEHAEAVDAHFRRLDAENTAPVADLANAADDYLLTSREILLRWASSQRYRVKLSGSIQALQDHMRADDRTADWISAAVRAKEQVEEDYRDYNRAVDALSTLLETFPAARDRMAPHVDGALLADKKVIATARTKALAASAAAQDEMEKIRQLRTYR